MSASFKVFTIFMLIAFCACSDEPAKGGGAISDEKPKIKVSDEFERDLAIAKKNSEKNESEEFTKGKQSSSDEKPKIIISEKLEKDIAIAKKNSGQNEKTSIVSLGNNYSILGNWKSRISVNRQITTFIFTYFDNGTYTGSSSGHLSNYHEEGTYSYDGTYISSRDSKGNSGKVKITWVNSDYLISKSVNSKNKSFCKRSESINNNDEIPFSFLYDENGKGLTDNTSGGGGGGGHGTYVCTACDGTGLIKADYASKTDCWTDEERIRPFMTDNKSIKLPCCLCSGTGRKSY
jgi:hypothetical protein